MKKLVVQVFLADSCALLFQTTVVRVPACLPLDLKMSHTSTDINHSAKTVLVPCPVPWRVSPSMSGLTLTHAEDDEPECTVVFGGGRPNRDGLSDHRRIEITFHSCTESRFRFLGDEYELGSEGFTLDSPAERFHAADPANYLAWLMQTWQRDGLCPQSGFWIAVEPLESDPHARRRRHHYVIAGRNGYIELFAEAYSWKEWIWEDANSEDVPASYPVVATGSSGDIT